MKNLPKETQTLLNVALDAAETVGQCSEQDINDLHFVFEVKRRALHVQALETHLKELLEERK